MQNNTLTWFERIVRIVQLDVPFKWWQENENIGRTDLVMNVITSGLSIITTTIEIRKLLAVILLDIDFGIATDRSHCTWLEMFY